MSQFLKVMFIYMNGTPSKEKNNNREVIPGEADTYLHYHIEIVPMIY